MKSQSQLQLQLRRTSVRRRFTSSQAEKAKPKIRYPIQSDLFNSAKYKVNISVKLM